MSIRDELQNHLGKTLFVLEPLDGREVVRDLIVSSDVDGMIWPKDWPDNRDGERLSEFRATLDAYSAGDTISVSDDPFQKPPETILSRVHPAQFDFCDIRVLEPSPGIRCFGGFGDYDLFIALAWDYRENLDDPAAWSQIIQDCKRQWFALFQAAPLHRRSLNECLSLSI